MHDSTGMLSKYTPRPPKDIDAPVLVLGVADVIAIEEAPAVGTHIELVSAAGKWVRHVVIPEGTAELIAELSERFTIVWASEWGPNAHVAFREPLGLPDDPWPYLPIQFNKLETIQRYAAGRPWAWIDGPSVDLEPIPADPGGLVIRVNPQTGLAGLSPAELDEIRELGLRR